MTTPVAANIGAQPWLLCRVGARLCALPLENVVETMRPLPIEPAPHSAPFVLGVSLIRGAPVPVLDVGPMLDAGAAGRGRLVTVSIAGRLVALAVDDVLGVRTVEPGGLSPVPPLLQAAGDMVAALGALDAELLFFLHAVRIPPEALTLDQPEPAEAS